VSERVVSRSAEKPACAPDSASTTETTALPPTARADVPSAWATSPWHRIRATGTTPAHPTGVTGCRNPAHLCEGTQGPSHQQTKDGNGDADR